MSRRSFERTGVATTELVGRLDPLGVGVVPHSHRHVRGRLRVHRVRHGWQLVLRVPRCQQHEGSARTSGKRTARNWIDGTAIAHLLDNPLARAYWFTDWLASLPLIVHQLMTWSVLALECGFVLLAVSGKLRPLAWLGMPLPSVLDVGIPR